MDFSRFVFGLAACLLLTTVIPIPAAEPPGIELPNIESKTLGGQYFWADELVYFGWRIQQHAHRPLPPPGWR